MFPEEVVAGADGEPHEPMLEGGVAAEGVQLGEGLEEHFLDDVFDLAFAAGVLARRAKNAGLIPGNEDFQRAGIARKNGIDQLRISWLHPRKAPEVNL